MTDLQQKKKQLLADKQKLEADIKQLDFDINKLHRKIYYLDGQIKGGRNDS